MDENFCSGSRFIWKNEKEMEIHWIIFIAELNIFIDGLQASESEAGKWLRRKLISWAKKWEWNEHFIYWKRSRHIMANVNGNKENVYWLKNHGCNGDIGI